ncbi:hypothetical protein FDP41_008496 [Naegleria fowleri]|uniref:AAR2 splicing factor homolog n=1 Tax=Naegleria fowleri TaxID=5763 RepID=A0A6A5BKB4_NAEFO|nr:uncharacterized protein FDP41_008496 [Naegleria fowleri]KAF0973289.1 hypothetical protein FDP41_008496 [Naegleria fowleri]
MIQNKNGSTSGNTEEDVRISTDDDFTSIVQGTVICLNVPELFEFGIDNYSHRLGKEFRSINQIPLDIPHLMYYNRIDHDKFGSGQGPRISFFHIFTREHPILILMFDENEEDFSILSRDNDPKFREVESQYKSGLFFKQIAPYSEDMKRNWPELVSFIDDQFLQRIEPIHRKITSTLHQEEQENHIDKKSNTIYYTHIPQKLNRKGLSPEQITKLNFDKSQLLEEILQSFVKRGCSMERATKELLAEMQFSFICLLHGQCLHGLNQWKKLVHLFCNCEDALLERNDIFISFVSILRCQFQMLPRDFIQDLVEHDFDPNEEELLEMTSSSTLEKKEQAQHKQKPKLSKRDHFLQKTVLQLFLTVRSIEEDDEIVKPASWFLFCKIVRKFKEFLEAEFEGCKEMLDEDEEDEPAYVYN